MQLSFLYYSRAVLGLHTRNVELGRVKILIFLMADMRHPPKPLPIPTYCHALFSIYINLSLKFNLLVSNR